MTREGGGWKLIALCVALVLTAGEVGARAPEALARDLPTSNNCTTCLGPIMNLGRGNDVLSGFRKTSIIITQFNRPELLFLTTKPNSALTVPSVMTVEMWPIVKALDQFGTWSHLKAVDKLCEQKTFPGRGTVTGCTTPTFDPTRATYKSRYVRFVLHYLVVPKKALNYSVGPGFSKRERALFDRYLCPPRRRTCLDHFNPPAVDIGRYLEITSYKMFQEDFFTPAPANLTPGSYTGQAPYDFATIHQSLLSGRDPAPSVSFVEDVNGEANVMIGLICAQDGRKPASVCGKGPIKRIVKAVK